MTVTVTLTYGPIEAEISGEDREEVQSELINFIDFVNENSEQLQVEAPPAPAPASGGSGEAVETVEESIDDHPLAPLAKKLGVDPADLDKIVYVDPDFEEEPQVLVEPESLGQSTVEQQRTAAYVLLYIWDEVYDDGRMRTTKLKDILELAGVSTSNLDRAWKNEGEGKFDSQGYGRSATVGLTGVGKRNALSRFQELVQ